MVAMRAELKKLLKEFMPPGLQRLRRSNVFKGDYHTWSEAAAASVGYDADRILVKVCDAMLKVKNGEAAYERDSVLFDEVQYSWPLLSALLWIASCGGNRLCLVDFGGALGSSYFQNRIFLDHLEVLQWNIVEQCSFVECGNRHFADRVLSFHVSLEDCLRLHPCDTILLASVLPYIEQPHELLDKVIEVGFEYIIIDRTPLLMGGECDRLTVQQVPANIYPASYPAWFFNRSRLLGHFAGRYKKIAEFDALSGSIRVGGTFAFEKGFLFKKFTHPRGHIKNRAVSVSDAAQSGSEVS
jgi:putative methyltransferase (TIGR04325 family)